MDKLNMQEREYMKTVRKGQSLFMKCSKEGVGNSTAGARFRNSKAGPGFV